MAKDSFQLATGIKLGDVFQTECELRELTAGDFLAASEESEKVVTMPTANGMEPELVTSPTLVGIHTLRRQIVKIGDITGPIELDTLNKLSLDDLNLIQQRAGSLEQAARSVSQRGRGDGADGGSPDSDQPDSGADTTQPH